uniref:Uncharacterized protein n=1 Tax=Arundo donax TaxID=35708 RepID=A0A0A9FYT6_ARUDO
MMAILVRKPASLCQFLNHELFDFLGSCSNRSLSSLTCRGNQ